MTDETAIKFKKPGENEKTRDRIPCLVVVEGNDKRYARIKVLKTVCKRMREELGERS